MPRENQMKVSPYQQAHTEEIRRICLKTAGAADGEQAQFTIAMYCNGYLENGICYVLINPAGSPVGYVLCAPDYDAYEVQMEQTLQTLRTLQPVYTAMAVGEMAGYKGWKTEYPAHLHIDILEEYTHCGGGTMLMDALIARLKELRVPGVMLMVSTENQRAIAFYKKCGFEILDQNRICLTMGRKIAT